MKKELFVFFFFSKSVLLIWLINLGSQILGAYTQYNVADFGHNQPLPTNQTW